MDSSVDAVWGYTRAMRDIHVVSSFRLVSVRRTRQGHIEQANTWPCHAVSRIIQGPFSDIRLFLLSFVLPPNLGDMNLSSVTELEYELLHVHVRTEKWRDCLHPRPLSPNT